MMREFINIPQALADNRVRLPVGLRDQDLCMRPLTELFELAPSTVSQPLSILWR